jgi:hypothetical protein
LHVSLLRNATLKSTRFGLPIDMMGSGCTRYWVMVGGYLPLRCAQ